MVTAALSVLAICLGVLVLAVGVALALLAVIGSLTPSPRRGLTPPPLDRPGHRYTCHCWLSPVKVVIAYERRRRHARRHRIAPKGSWTARD